MNTTRLLLTLCAAVALFASNTLAGDEPPLRPAIAIDNLPIFKRITLGTYKGVNTVRDALDSARMRVGDSADEILGRPAFTFSKTGMDVSLVVVAVADLGFALKLIE